MILNVRGKTIKKLKKTDTMDDTPDLDIVYSNYVIIFTWKLIVLYKFKKIIFNNCQKP